MKTILLTLLLVLAVNVHAGPPVVRHPNQFQFGFEPTKTNLFFLWESFYATVKKAVTGKGKGVLEIEGKYNSAVREDYLKMVRESCPKCKITEVRESHGTISYQITYPEGFYIRSSLDAGALEWQTKPSTITEIEKNLKRLQHDVFDLSKEAGANMLLKNLGGHTTFSGFGGDTFWFGNYLKFRTKNTVLDWGFFGKDSYNAKPVQMWAEDQQHKYSMVHQEHDAKWDTFLRSLESKLDGNEGTDEVIKAFNERQIFSQKEYTEKLFNIYFNPDQESKLTGKRSKPKYVANKPGLGFIENRAIRPQKNAEQLVKMAKFIEAEAWYVKERMNEGYEVNFEITPFEKKSSTDISAESRKIIRDLGLNWTDYEEFSRVGDVETTGLEKDLKSYFTPKKYGSAKRDELYRRVRERLSKNSNWSETETVFASSFLNEMAYTIPVAEENAAIIAARFDISKISNESVEAVMKNIVELNIKFPSHSPVISKIVKPQLLAYVDRAIENPAIKGLGNVLSLVAHDEAEEILKKVVARQKSSFDSRLIKTHADLILRQAEQGSNIEKETAAYFALLEKNPVAALPSRLDELAAVKLEEMSARSSREKALVNLVEYLATNPAAHVTEADMKTLELLAGRYPKRSKEIYSPLRKYLSDVIVANKYGIDDYYKTVVYFELLNSVTPVDEKKKFLKDFKVQVEKMHAIKNDPDSLSFIEKVDTEMASLKTERCSYSMGSKFLAKFRKTLGL